MALYSVELVSILAVLGLILYMNVKYTMRSDTKKQFLMLYHAGSDCSDLTRVEAERIQRRMAERLSVNNSRLADEFLAIILANIRQEKLEEEEEKEHLKNLLSPDGKRQSELSKSINSNSENEKEEQSEPCMDSYHAKFVDETQYTSGDSDMLTEVKMHEILH